MKTPELFIDRPAKFVLDKVISPWTEQAASLGISISKVAAPQLILTFVIGKSADSLIVALLAPASMLRLFTLSSFKFTLNP